MKKRKWREITSIETGQIKQLASLIMQNLKVHLFFLFVFLE